MNRFLVTTLGLLGAVGLAQASVPVTHSAAGHAPTILPPEAPATVLYDQMNNAAANATVSQDFEPANATFNSKAGDDFVVPAGVTWTVTGVDVAGQYFNGPGPAASFNVFFYANAGTNLPGALVASRPTQAYTGGASPVITLSTPVVLTAGTYWVSVQARMDFTPGGEWGWTDRTVTSNNPSAWQNPGGGFGTTCTNWSVKTTCIPTATGDNLFRLNGTATAAPTVTKAFSPASVPAGVSSALTITLANSNATAATLTTDLTDTFPAGLTIAARPNAATTCTGGAVSVTGNSVRLASGASIPGAGSCTVTVNVSSGTPGSYANSIAAGALQTDAGSNAASAKSTLTVTAPPACNGGTDEIFCDGFEVVAATYTDRTTFLTHVAPGYYQNPFANAVPGPSGALSYSDPASGIAYTVDSVPTANDLYNGSGVISTSAPTEKILVTFTGTPVTAVGGNFWATDANLAPTGTDVTLTLSDATTLTFTSTGGPSDFRGFTTVAPVTSITIDAPDVPNPAWPTMDNLILGTAN